MANRKRHHAALPKGHRLHWYEIESILGQGGFGITYLATDTTLDTKVAIKEFLPTDLAVRTHDSAVEPMSQDHEETFAWGLSRFVVEAKTLAKFEHYNIVRVQAVFDANNTAYMVMSYVEGQTLEDALKFRRIESEPQLLDILFPLLDGLEKVHQEGFIHRDIKPDNIYIREDGTAVLLDFGSARQTIGAKTRTLTALVSPGYAPYEQYGSKDADRQGPWTDIYALGATLYRAVSGKGPMDAIERGSGVMTGGKDSLVPAVQVGAGAFSKQFLEAIDQAIVFMPEDRPQTIAEWRRMFPETAGVPEDPTENEEQDEAATIVAPEIVPGPSSVKPRSRMPLWTVLAAAVLLVAGAAYLWHSFGVPAEPPTEGVPIVEGTTDTKEEKSQVPEQTTAVEDLEGETARQTQTQTQEEQPQAAQAQQLAEQQRLAEEQAALAALEAKKQKQERLQAEEAARNAEAQRLAEEQAAKLAEVQRQLEQEQARLAEIERQRKLTHEQQQAEEQRKAQAQRLAEEQAKLAQIQQKLEEEQTRLAEIERTRKEAEQQAEEEAKRQAEEQAQAAALKTQQEEAEGKAAEEQAQQTAERDLAIQTLLILASADIDALRLNSPSDNNAVEKIERVLALEPENAPAKKLRSEVVGKYLGLAQSALDDNDPDKAEVYVARAETIEPGSELIETMRNRIFSAHSQLAQETLASEQITSAQETEQTHQPGEEVQLKPVTVTSPGGFEPRMVSIKGGCFEMGSPAGEEGHSDDERLHQVCVDNFSIAISEVTFAQYDRYTQATDAAQPDDNGWGRDDRPVIDVSWTDAMAYAEWLSRETGKRYRLPTEAEWEYAARAGSRTAYPWGNAIGNNRANCDGCGSRWGDEQTAPVGSFAPNTWGLHDTVGNVWEWTCSAADESYDGGEQRCASLGTDGERVFRGGSWVNYPNRVRSAHRYWFGAGFKYNFLGFRLARD